MAEPGLYKDLTEHISTLVTLLGIFAGCSAMLLWRMLIRMEKKMDDIWTWILGDGERCSECKKDFLTVKAFEDWKEEHTTQFAEWRLGRNGPGGLWDIINKIREKIKI